MRISAIHFLLLALSLPVFAHHDRDEHEHRHSQRHHRMIVEGCRPRVIEERRLAAPWEHHGIRHGRRHERGMIVLPPPVILHPHVRFRLGF